MSTRGNVESYTQVSATRELEAHRKLIVGDVEPDPASLVFPTRNGTPLRRSNFRRQVWRPALVRAGLLGNVETLGDTWHATWPDSSGTTRRRKFLSEREAVRTSSSAPQEVRGSTLLCHTTSETH